MFFSGRVLAVWLMCMPLLLVHAAEQDSGNGAEALPADTQNTAAVPPPPPGPYISTALADNEQFVGGHDMSPPPGAASPFFTPDMPWPDHRMPQKWMPDEGYQFAPPMLSERLSQQQAHHPSRRNHMMPMTPRRAAPPQRPMPPAQMPRPRSGSDRMPEPRQPMARPPHMPRPPASTDMPRGHMPAGRDAMQQPKHAPMAMPPRRGSPMPDRQMRGKPSQRPHMNNRPMHRESMQRGAMQHRAMPQRDMPPPPRGPWLPLGNYPGW